MNREFLKKIFFQSLTAFLSLALAILLFFAIQKLRSEEHTSELQSQR